MTNVSTTNINRKDIGLFYESVIADGSLSRALQNGTYPENEVIKIIFFSAEGHLSELKKCEDFMINSGEYSEYGERKFIELNRNIVNSIKNTAQCEKLIFFSYPHLNKLLDNVIKRCLFTLNWGLLAYHSFCLSDQHKSNLTRITKTYIVYNPCTGLIKIGKSIDPRSRINTLETQAGTRFNVIAIIGEDIESELHKKFSYCRTIGEWFKDDNGEILKYAESISSFSKEDLCR